jgi:hypothetical protein
LLPPSRVSRPPCTGRKYKAKLGLENLSSIIGGRQKPKKEVKSEKLSSIIGGKQKPKKEVRSENLSSIIGGRQKPKKEMKSENLSLKSENFIFEVSCMCAKIASKNFEKLHPTEEKRNRERKTLLRDLGGDLNLPQPLTPKSSVFLTYPTCYPIDDGNVFRHKIIFPIYR